MGNEKTEDQTKTEIMVTGRSSKGLGIGHREKTENGYNVVRCKLGGGNTQPRTK
jgi:hypothetical protein